MVACMHAVCYLQVIIVGVLSQAAVEEGPSEVVHRILLAGDGLVHDLSNHVIMQEVVQVALHRVRLKQELLVVFLAWSVAHQHAPAVMVAVLLREITGRTFICSSRFATGCSDQ